MANGSTTNSRPPVGANSIKNTSQTASTSSLAPLTGFAFHTIGKLPSLLGRIDNSIPPQANEGNYPVSPSPSPDLEDQLLLPSESGPDEDDPTDQPPPRRNRLLEALAPDHDADMDDMYVQDQDDDVNATSVVGANLGPKEASSSSQTQAPPSSAASAVINSRTQSGSRSSGQQPYATPRSSLSQTDSNSSSSVAADTAKNSSAKQDGSQRRMDNPGSGSSPSDPPVPSTLASDTTSDPQPPATEGENQYNSLRVSVSRLEAILANNSRTQNLDSIRQLAQAAKVGEASVSAASQKAVVLAQKSLTAAHEAMVAAQNVAKASQTAKAQYEALVQACEKAIAEQTAAGRARDEAVKKELLSLVKSIDTLEQEDRIRAQQLEEQHQIVMNAMDQKRNRVSSTPLPTPPASSSTDNAALPSASSSSIGSSAEINYKHEFEMIKKELAALRQLANQNQERNQMQLDDQQRSRAPNEPTRTSPVSEEHPIADPQKLEEELRNKLKSHKKTPSHGTVGSSSSPASTRPMIAPLPPAPVVRDTQPKSTKIAQVKTETSTDIAVKSEPVEAKLPPPSTTKAVVPPLSVRHRKEPSMTPNLEYPPISPASQRPPATPPATTLSSHKTRESLHPLTIPRVNIRSPFKTQPLPSTGSGEPSPILLHRQGPDPGNLPIVYPARNSPEEVALARRVLVKAEPVEAKVPPPTVAQKAAPTPPADPVHPPIATLSNRVDTPITPSNNVPLPTRVPAKNANKGNAQATQPRSSSSISSTASKPPPASAQLPAKPVVSQTTPLPSMRKESVGQAPQSSQPSVPARAELATMSLAEAITAQQAQLADRGVNHEQQRNEREKPASNRPPAVNTDRSYRPHTPPLDPPRERERSRSPVRRSRDAPHRPLNWDHYSPPPVGRMGPRRRSSRSRSRSRSPPPRSAGPHPGRTLANRMPSPPPPRRRRRSPSPVPRRGGPYPPPASQPTAAAGTKRPIEEAGASNAPPTALRRRIDEDRPGPSTQRGPPPAPPAPERNTEDGSRTADYNGSPGSASVISLGSVIDSPRQVYQQPPVQPQQQQYQPQQQVVEDRGPALADRLSDARAVRGVNGNGITASSSGSNPPSRMNSPSRDPRRGGDGVKVPLSSRIDQGQRGGPSRGHRGGPRGGGRGRGASNGGGGGSGASSHHQPLNTRISSAPAPSGSSKPLLARITQDS